MLFKLLPYSVKVYLHRTDALFIALRRLGVSPGDEIITPAFGWISSAETITLAAGKPVFADVLPET